jgi:hypothetical protein
MELKRRRGKRRGAQLVRFTIARRFVWQHAPHSAGGYIGHFLSEPAVAGWGRTLAELRARLVTTWRWRHDARVKPTGRPRRRP